MFLSDRCTSSGTQSMPTTVAVGLILAKSAVMKPEPQPTSRTLAEGLDTAGKRLSQAMTWMSRADIVWPCPMGKGEVGERSSEGEKLDLLVLMKPLKTASVRRTPSERRVRRMST